MSTYLRFTIPPRTALGLLTCVMVGGLAALVVSVLLIFFLPGGHDSIDETLPGTGPIGELISEIVPIVWVALFGGLGAGYWLVAAGQDRLSPAGLAVIGLVVLCMVYPILASGTANPVWAILGNLVTIVSAVITARVCWPRSRLGAVFPALVVAWVGIATAGLAALAMGLTF